MDTDVIEMADVCGGVPRALRVSHSICADAQDPQPTQ